MKQVIVRAYQHAFKIYERILVVKTFIAHANIKTGNKRLFDLFGNMALLQNNVLYNLVFIVLKYLGKSEKMAVINVQDCARFYDIVCIRTSEVVSN